MRDAQERPGSRFVVDVRLPVNEAADMARALANGPRQWKKGFSAYELAASWVGAGDIPPAVRRVLDTRPALREARLLQGYFERKTDLRSAGRPSQTDLLAVLATPSGRVVVGVEGKVEETFGQRVSAWLAAGGEGRVSRLAGLCGTLGLDPAAIGDIRYQLLHRTVAAIYEARRLGGRRAMMLVHSFSPANTGFADFQAFAALLGAPLETVDAVSAEVRLDGVAVRLGWVADQPEA